MAKAIQYPLLSKIVDADRDISLNNPNVEQWEKSALTKIWQLHKDIRKEILSKSPDGRDVSLLDVHCSKDCNISIVNESRTGWIGRDITMSIGKGMSLSGIRMSLI